MEDLSKISVVLPSLNPDEKLVQVIDGLLEYGFTDIILVNDGSKPENLHYFTEQAEKHPEITLLHHEVNKGKGAALKNAFRWFLANRPEGKGVVSVDGDNQHHPEDTRNCALHMLRTGHSVLGCRDFSQEDVPPRSRFGNRTTSLVFKFFCGMTLSDTQTGLRALPTKALKTLVNVAGDRFEYETNMLLAFKENRLPYDEVKIRTVYIEENKSSHFRVLHDSWRIYKLILGYFFRYTVSAIISWVLEVVIVALLAWLLQDRMALILVSGASTAGGRITSSVLNFYLNKKLVFHSSTNTGVALMRYIMLAVPQMLLQILLTSGVCGLFGVEADGSLAYMLIYCAVMIVLFIFSYTIQQRWVFAPQTKGQEDE